jgi:predicted Zn finger-like uncharacterized protein
MAIDVTCPACKTRFQVSEKFAGKSGPCPKCKQTIKVPDKTQQVVIHAPDETATKTATGQPIFKPIARTEVRLQTWQIAAIVGSVLLVLVAAIVLRLQHPSRDTLNILLPIGAVALAPILAFAGYTFLRDDELEPFRGNEVLLRSLACGLAWAALWGGYWFIVMYFAPAQAARTAAPAQTARTVAPAQTARAPSQAASTSAPSRGGSIPPPNWPMMGVIVAVMIAMGAVASQASFELELGTGALHYSMYLVSIVILRLIMGLDVRWAS